MNSRGEKPLNCLKCAHFKITWEAEFPRACELFGFKSRAMPSALVLRSTGQPCPAFRLKEGLK